MKTVNLSNGESFKIWSAANAYSQNIKNLPPEDRKVVLLALKNMRTRTTKDNDANDALETPTVRVIEHLKKPLAIEKSDSSASRLYKKVKKIFNKELSAKHLKAEVQKITNSRALFQRNSQLLEDTKKKITVCSNNVGILKQKGSALIADIKEGERKAAEDKTKLSTLKKIFFKEPEDIKRKKHILKMNTIHLKTELKELKNLHKEKEKLEKIIDEEKEKLLHAADDDFTKVDDPWEFDADDPDLKDLKFQS